jgi:histidinol-phosphatase (PHP family)
MKKFIVDTHTHSTFSFDGRAELKDMLATAQEKGVGFYGVSEHFNYDYNLSYLAPEEAARVDSFDPDGYFHEGRHLQEDYAGVMNGLIGAEFGFSDDETVKERYREAVEKYAPDFVINSVHSNAGKDYYYYVPTEDKIKVYGEYLSLIRRSLDAPYHYDIVGHIGYVARYVPFEDKQFSLEEFGAELDDIFLTIIRKNKVLEVNTSNKQLKNRTIPSKELLQRYFDLGGRKISFGSDAHFVSRIADKWGETVEMLKGIGFTHLTVPYRGEYVEVEL